MSVEHYTTLTEDQLKRLLRQETWQVESNHPLATGQGDDSFALHAISHLYLPDILGNSEVEETTITVVRNPELSEPCTSSELKLTGMLKEARLVNPNRIELLFEDITDAQRDESRGYGFWRELDTEDSHNIGNEEIGLVLVKPHDAPPGWSILTTTHTFPMRRTPRYCLPGALHEGDELSTHDRLLSDPRFGDPNVVWIELSLHGWCAVDARLPIALRPVSK